MIRVANGLPQKPVFGFMGCMFLHEKNTIPCVHVNREGHDVSSCKFDHTYYRNPTSEENDKIKQTFEKRIKFSTTTSCPAPAPAPAAAAAASRPAPAPVVASRPAPAPVVASRPAPAAAAAAVSQKADDQQPPFPAPSGKYWEQFKGGWVLKLNSTASK
jgi:hypothetical protein